MKYFLWNLPRPIQCRLPLVAIFLSSRVLWGGGGGGRSSAPGRAKVAQTPGHARVKTLSIFIH